jgi:hypothetical protein
MIINIAVILAIFYLIIKMSFAKYIVIDEPSTKGGESVFRSFDITKGHFWETVLFYLSFAGWFIPGIIANIISAFAEDPQLYGITNDIAMILYIIIGMLWLAQVAFYIYIYPRFYISLAGYARYLIYGFPEHKDSEPQIPEQTPPPPDDIHPITSYPEI